MERAISFGHQAERYDAARPSYPAAAVDWLVELEVTDAPQVMEVGCGTGILTRQLVERSCQGIALDPDPAMLAVARRSGVREFRFECSTFENWSSTHRFDLVVAGQSWHWVDDSAGFPLAHEALRPGGHLVLLWNRPASEGF
jgi:trans-aconitate methyltransferase